MASYRVSQARYTRVAIVLHWAIAALILFNLALGYFMEGFAPPLRGIIVPLHISSGITVLALTVIRVLWRLTHQPPPNSADMKRWEHDLAHIVHFLLYAAMVLMPLTGWAIISAHPPKGSPGAAAVAASRPVSPPAMAQALPPSGRPTGQPPAPPRGGGGPKIWGVIPLPPIAPVADVGTTVGGVEPQKALHEDFVTWHGIGGYILIALLILHIAGALKHQLVDKHAELARMGIGRPETEPLAAE